MTTTEMFVSVFEALGIPVGGLLLLTYILLYDKKMNAKEREAHREERDEWRTSSEAIQNANREVITTIQRSSESLQERNIDALHEFKDVNRDMQSRNIHAIEELTHAIKDRNSRHD